MSLEKIATKEVVTIDAEATVQEAAKAMREMHVGTLVVTKNENMPVGMLTDRDIVVSTTAFGISPESVKVREILSPTFIKARIDASVEHVLGLMREHSVRRVPLVTPDGTLGGIIAADDITNYLARKLTDIAKISSKQKDVEIEKRPKY